MTQGKIALEEPCSLNGSVFRFIEISANSLMLPTMMFLKDRLGMMVVC